MQVHVGNGQYIKVYPTTCNGIIKTAVKKSIRPTKIYISFNWIKINHWLDEINKTRHKSY